MYNVYIQLKDLDYYQKNKIDALMQESGMNLQDFLSLEQLIELLCDIYSKYYYLQKEYQILIDFLDGKR